jgi:GT2 family glycosyltransferase
VKITVAKASLGSSSVTAPSMPAVTVAIATADRAEALERCLASLASSVQTPDEIVVVDQSRGTATRAVTEAAALPVTYVVDTGRGLGRAQNLAFAAATGPVVAVLDDDCVADERWIASISETFSADPELAGLAGRVLPLEPAPPGTVAISTRPSTVRRTFGFTLEPWNVGSGNNFALRRDWFERIGGCDERLGPGAKGRGGLDMDLFYRLLRAGGTMVYEPAVLVFHETKPRRERVMRRTNYGYGMGAAAVFRHHEHDPRAYGLLRTWLAYRARLLVRAFAQGRLRSVYEEMLMLGGTLSGVVFALRHDTAKPRSSTR